MGWDGRLDNGIGQSRAVRIWCLIGRGCWYPLPCQLCVWTHIGRYSVLTRAGTLEPRRSRRGQARQEQKKRVFVPECSKAILWRRRRRVTRELVDITGTGSAGRGLGASLQLVGLTQPGLQCLCDYSDYSAVVKFQSTWFDAGLGQLVTAARPRPAGWHWLPALVAGTNR